MELPLLLPLAAFLVLLALFAVTLRRAGRVVAETREMDAFRRATADLAGRVEQSLRGVQERIDGVRRREVEAEVISENIAAALDAIPHFLEEARALRPPAGLSWARSAIIEELERASRALEMVEHGCAVVRSAMHGNRELEAETSIKRGYLNLLHAREAITAQVAAIAAARPSGARPVRWRKGGPNHTM